MLRISLLFWAVFGLIACRQEPTSIFEPSDVASIKQLSDERAALADRLALPNALFNYAKPLPGYLHNLGLRPAPVENVKATIGRVLFYEKGLSADASIACASCHKQALAFSDSEAKSTGIFGRKTLRNSPPLANVSRVSAHYASIDGKPAPHFFWDNRARTVAEQTAETMSNDLEMGFSGEKAAEFVGSQLYYGTLWRDAFGHFSPKKEEVLECLEAFVGSIGSATGRLDQGLEQVGGDISQPATIIDTIIHAYYSTETTTVVNPGIKTLSIDENRGRILFVKHCTECHSPLRRVQDVLAACTGLDENYADNGMGDRSKNASEMGVFKSPSLRNIALTAPYMHDGRFKTLMEVVNFYDSEVKPHPNLHPLLKNADGSPKKLNLSLAEKTQLIAFLNALTDEPMRKDERFSNPFK